MTRVSAANGGAWRPTGAPEPLDLESTLRSARSVSSPESLSDGRASFGRPMVGEEQGGGRRRPMRHRGGGVFDSLLGPRDPRPLPAPTRGGGCAGAWRAIPWALSGVAIATLAVVALTLQHLRLDR